MGRVLHAGQPPSNYDFGVQLCSDFYPNMPYSAYTSPCSGTKYKTSIDSNGYFIFDNVQPIGYKGIVFMLPGNQVYEVWSKTTPYVVSVEAGQIVFFGTKDINY